MLFTAIHFSLATGVTPENTICVDWLHNLSLGVFKDFLGAAVNKVIHTDNVYRQAGTLAMVTSLSVTRLQSELFAFYRLEAREHRVHTRVQHMESNCFGKPDSPCCNLHGAEVNGFLSFVANALLRKPGISNPEPWLRLACLLDRIKNLIHEHKFNFSASAIQDSSIQTNPNSLNSWCKCGPEFVVQVGAASGGCKWWQEFLVQVGSGHIIK